MQLPGIRGALDEAIVREKAELEAERLAEELKKEVRVEARDIGTLRKELHVTVPAKVIGEHLDHNYEELRHDAIVPGFRKGRAPRQLIEKRFGAEVRESLVTSIVGQSYFAAIEQKELQVLGEPRFRVATDEGVRLLEIDEALPHLKLPADGDFDYVCEVEIKPVFELPELKGIPVHTPEVTIDDQMVEDELLRQRKIRGRFEPQPADATVERDDLVVANIVLRVDGEQVDAEDNVQFGVRPSVVNGIEVRELHSALEGARAGETRQVDCQIPDDYSRVDLRGKRGQFEFKLHEIKRLAPLSMEEFLERSGFESEKEARDYYRMLLENERDSLVVQLRRQQVYDYLLQNTTLELPEQLSGRQIDRAVARRIIEMQRRGIPESDIAARIDQVRTSAKEEALRDLKLTFILDKVAETLNIQVTDEEVNTAIAQIARRYNRRFDRVRDELQRQDLLGRLAEQIRHDKCVAHLLDQAAQVDEPPEGGAADPKPRGRRVREGTEEPG